MEDEKKPTEEEIEQKDVDYLEVIKNLKNNTVSKDEYEKMHNEYKKVLDAYVEGKELDGVEVKPTEEVSVDDIAKKLINADDMSNLEYAQLSLAYRDALIKGGKTDPFLPQGPKILATEEDINAANRVAEALADCIEYAQGDNNAFTNELSRIMVDASPLINRRR